MTLFNSIDDALIYSMRRRLVDEYIEYSTIYRHGHINHILTYTIGSIALVFTDRTIK